MSSSWALLYLCLCKRGDTKLPEHTKTHSLTKNFTIMMTTFFKTVSIALAFIFTPVLANDFDATSVEKTYVKCTINEKGERVPNYFVVVDGIAHQTDSRTFFEIKKVKAYVKKNMANNEVAGNMENVESTNDQDSKIN